MSTLRAGHPDLRTGPAGQRAPRLGVLDFHAIQYHVPLYQQLTARGRVTLDVAYLRDHGLTPVIDTGFGVPVAWDIDLRSGYRHEFLPGSVIRRGTRLIRWLRDHDVVVIHGHSDPWMLFAVAACRATGLPYLLRGDSGPHGQSGGWRGGVRYGVARTVVGGSAGGLAVGRRNEQFYAAYRAPESFFAPHSVDNDRFAAPPPISRADLLSRWGLDPERPVVMFCGKLRDAKRPLDLAAAVGRLGQPVSALFVGDGALAGRVREMLAPGRGAVTGFVNQAELPAYYHAADVLVLPSEAEPWGLVVNEAMCAGVLPVVSDRVGCGPDLVAGLGEIYPCGDVGALTEALRRALARARDPEARGEARQRVARYGIAVTAAGFEQAAAALTAAGPRPGPRTGPGRSRHGTTRRPGRPSR